MNLYGKYLRNAQIIDIFAIDILIHYFLNHMNTQNTYSSEGPTRWNLKRQISDILVSPFLRGRLFINSIPPRKSLNQPTQINALIRLLPKPDSTINQLNSFISLGITLPEQHSSEEPTFILSNCDQSTYREKQIQMDGCWDPSHRLVEIIQDIVRSIDEEIIDIRFLDMSRTKVNLQSGLQEQNQGLNISRNSCFKFSSNNPLEGGFYKGLVVREEDSKAYGNLQKFREYQKKRNNQPMKKNANLPKFLIRIFIKYVEKFRKVYQKKQFDRLNTECKKMKEWKRSENKQQALGLKHLKMLFQEFKDGFPDPRLNRQIVTDIISKYLLEEICQNSQIPQTHRLGYLVACRVYALRCRNATLAGRIQSK